MRELERQSEPIVLFIHIPKTAGRTLHGIMRRNTPRRQLLLLNRDSVGHFAIPDLSEYNFRSNGIRLIHGHMVFGAHNSVSVPTTYVTVLRDPVARVISHYRFVRRTPIHHEHNLAMSMSLAEFVESGVSVEVDNCQTRDIAGDTNSPFGALPMTTLARAKENLDKFFSVVGVTERFDETLLVMRHALGWQSIRLRARE